MTTWLDDLRGIKTTDSYASEPGQRIERVQGSTGAWTWEKRRGFITVDADATGVIDATPAIRAALAGARPGQCVFLPDGRYKINHSSHIIIPYGVTLCGSERGMNVGPFLISGTSSLGHMGAQLFVTGTADLLAPLSQAKIANLEIYYPNQDGASAEPGHGTFSGTPVNYGWTIDCEDVDNATIENVHAINPLDFIRMRGAGTITDINAWPLRTGIRLGRCADTVRISRVQFNRSSMLHFYDSTMLDWVLANCQTFLIGGAEQFEITDAFVFSVWRGLVFKDFDGNGFNLGRGSFKGGGLDTCGTCILVDQPSGAHIHTLSISDTYLSSSASAIVFQDTTVKTDNGRPTIEATNIRFGGSCVNAVKLSTGSYGRYKQTLGSVYSNSGPAFYAQSSTSSIRLYGVDVNTGVGNRTGGAGDIEDIYYGSAP